MIQPIRFGNRQSQWQCFQRLRSLSSYVVHLLGFSLIAIVATSYLLLPTFAAPLVSDIAVSFPVASIHTYQEQPGQTTFRSKQSLRDRRDRSWQVILFKRYQAKDLQGLYLRLVGFPGIVSVKQKQPIIIATGASKQWQAKSELDPQTPELPEYAAQYNMAQAISELAGDIPLQVDISLKDGSTAQLVVPPFAVREWRELYAQSPE